MQAAGKVGFAAAKSRRICHQVTGTSSQGSSLMSGKLEMDLLNHVLRPSIWIRACRDRTECICRWDHKPILQRFLSTGKLSDTSHRAWHRLIIINPCCRLSNYPRRQTSDFKLASRSFWSVAASPCDAQPEGHAGEAHEPSKSPRTEPHPIASANFRFL